MTRVQHNLRAVFLLNGSWLPNTKKKKKKKWERRGKSNFISNLILPSSKAHMIISGFGDERVGKYADDGQEAECQETTTTLTMSAD